MDPATDRRRQAISALIGIAAFEAVMLVAVVAVFLATDNTIYLFGGLIGAQIVAAPIVIRWARDWAAIGRPPGETER